MRPRWFLIHEGSSRSHSWGCGGSVSTCDPYSVGEFVAHLGKPLLQISEPRLQFGGAPCLSAAKSCYVLWSEDKVIEMDPLSG